MRTRALLPAVSIAAAGLLPSAAVAQEGCVGAPSEPATYVCVGVYPENVLPGYGIGSEPRSVTVPGVCYFVGCTGTTTYEVPVPTVSSSGSGGEPVTITWAGADIDDAGDIGRTALGIVLNGHEDEFQEFVQCTVGRSC